LLDADPHKAITTASGYARCQAVIGVVRIAIVTQLTLILHSIAAALDYADGAAPISTDDIAVIASLTIVDYAITTARHRAV